MKTIALVLLAAFAAFGGFGGDVSAGLVVNHTAVAGFDQYKNDPGFQNAIESAKQTFHVGYGHTSHGSQITSGMTGLNAFMNNLGYPPDLFAWNNGGSGGALDLEEGDGYGEGWLDHDCGYVGWDDETRNYLNGSDPGAGTADHSDVNVIMWSWCGQVNDVNLQTHYLDNMGNLENEYPNVTFVYMTGHLEGYKSGDSWFDNNDAIRDWVAQDQDRVLFDFADIEKYDPDQNINYADYFADDNCDYDSDGTAPRNEDANWATDWQNNHTEGVDWYSVYCAHSISLNCNQKAKAFWYMMAFMGGWSEGGGSNPPAINNTCGDFVNGDSVVISGSGFGIHADHSPNGSYLPAAWTDFESGYVDYDVWARLGPGPELAVDQQRPNSAVCARSGGDYRNFTNVFGEVITNELPRSFYNPNTADSQVLFISGWFMFPNGTYYALTHNVAEQCKFISTLDVNNNANQYWNIPGWQGDTEVDLKMNFEDGRGAAGPSELRMYGPTGNAVINENEWHRFDIAVDVTKDYGLKESRFYADGKEYTTDYNRYYREDCDPCPRHFVGSFFIRYIRNAGWYQYFDDAFVDNSWARVEICNESIWNESKRRHCEIQIPTAWSNSSITFTVNQGSFTNGTAYLFVVDENGTVSEGYPVTFEEGGHKADLNDDGVINMPELMAFIARWRAGDGVTKAEVLDARWIWFNGGGY